MEYTPKTIGITILSVVLAIGALFGVYKLVSVPPQAAAPVNLNVSKQDWNKGNPNAKNVLVEYSDLQCPACKSYEPLIKQFIQKHAQDVFFVYRHYPLPMHKNSVVAAVAAEAAGKQNKFWEMHDLLFDKQDEWAESNNPNEMYLAYAKELKLNEDQFKKDLSDQNIKNKIQKSVDSGNAVGVNSTPTFYMNGIKIDLPRAVEDLEKNLAK